MIRQSDGLDLVAEVGDARSLYDALGRLLPDVLVLDPMLEGLRISELFEHLERQELGTRVVLLWSVERPADAYYAVQSGAMASLSKQATGVEVQSAILRAARGMATLAPDLQTALFAEARLRRYRDRCGLTDREYEVLLLLPDGRSLEQIAEELMVTRSTVRTHVSRIFGKLGVRSQIAAVATAMRLGILD